MEDYYLDKKAIQTIETWIKESEGIRNVFLTLNWYEPIGQTPDFSEEKEVTFDNLQELGEFLKQNRWIAE